MCRLKFAKTKIAASAGVSALLGLTALLVQVGLFTNSATAASPPGCSGCGVDLQLTRDVGVVESGGTVNFTVRIGNDISGSCNIANATVTVYCPGLDGKPDKVSGGHVLTT